MRTKIFAKLKQEYSHLGLGDAILQAQADALSAMGVVTEDNLNMVVMSQKSFLENLQKENDKRATDAYNKAKMNEKKADHEDTEIPEWYKSEKEKSEKLIKSLQDTISVLNEKNEKFEKEKIVSERKALITAKAQELGIPKYRIDEGFMIADDADDISITNYLTTVANNIKTQLLPNKKNVFPLANGEIDKVEADAIAESLVQ